MRAAAAAGLFHRHRPGRLAGARAGPAVPRGAPRHRAHRGRRRGQGRAAGQAAARGHAGGAARASRTTVFSVLSVRKLGAEPDQLWGNGATERAQNGASLDKAVGKGRRKGLETGRVGLENDWLFRRLIGVADCEAGFRPGRECTAVCRLGAAAALLAAGQRFGLAGCGVRGSLEAPPQASSRDRRRHARHARPARPAQTLHPRPA